MVNYKSSESEIRYIEYIIERKVKHEDYKIDIEDIDLIIEKIIEKNVDMLFKISNLLDTKVDDNIFDIGCVFHGYFMTQSTIHSILEDLIQSYDQLEYELEDIRRYNEHGYNDMDEHDIYLEHQSIMENK